MAKSASIVYNKGTAWPRYSILFLCSHSLLWLDVPRTSIFIWHHFLPYLVSQQVCLIEKLSSWKNTAVRIDQPHSYSLKRMPLLIFTNSEKRVEPKLLFLFLINGDRSIYFQCLAGATVVDNTVNQCDVWVIDLPNLYLFIICWGKAIGDGSNDFTVVN